MRGMRWWERTLEMVNISKVSCEKMGFPKRNEDGASKSVERKIGDLYLYLMRLFLPQHHKTKHPFKLVA